MAKNKKRKIGTIWKNLQEFLNPSNPAKVKPGQPLSTYQGGPMNNQAALIAALNRHPPFAKDKVSLPPQDVPPNASVGELLVALVVEYDANGWDVVR